MNITPKIGILATLLFVNANLFAQETPFKLGVRLGGGMSVTTGLDKILFQLQFQRQVAAYAKGTITGAVKTIGQSVEDKVKQNSSKKR